MGILNIDEHVEEHRLMAIRYPDKAVIPGQSVIAQSNIPFLIMPGDGGANGCRFSGTAGAFTLSAAILANLQPSIAECYCYFSANFGGSARPAGWYYTEFSSDTAGIVYTEMHSSGTPVIPETKTAFAENLTGRITASTGEITAMSFPLPANVAGKNGLFEFYINQCGSSAGNKTYIVSIDTTNVVRTGNSTNPVGGSLHYVACVNSHTKKQTGRMLYSAPTGLGVFGNSVVAAHLASVDTSVDRALNVIMQGSTNLAAPIMLNFSANSTFGE